MITGVDKVLEGLQEIDNEEIKRHHQVKAALHDLKLVVNIAYAFLDGVDDLFYYCQGVNPCVV